MKTRFFKIVFLLLFSLFTVVSCKNSGNNPTETFTLELTATPSNAGNVSPTQGSYDAGEEVQITATANSHWVFKEWNGNYTGTDNPATITINQDMSINALFEELTYPLTVEVEGNGQVNEEIATAKTDYTEGTVVQLTAVPDEHWQFVEWSGDFTGMENPATITMDQPKTVTAVFEEQTYPLTVNIEGEGDVSEEIVNAKNYTYGTVVELTANPAKDWRFGGWTGDLESDQNPATITIDAPKNVQANFEYGFNETFDDGKAQNWLFSDNQFVIEDGKLKYFIEKGTKQASAYYDKKFKNFKFETSVSLASQKHESFVTIFIRSTGFLVQDEENEVAAEGYFIAMNSNGALFAKAEEIGGEVKSEVFLETTFDLETGPDHFHVITINANGSNFDFYINGNYIYSFSDETFTEGYVTIATVNIEGDKNYQTSWDYVKVSAADPPQKTR